MAKNEHDEKKTNVCQRAFKARKPKANEHTSRVCADEETGKRIRCRKLPKMIRTDYENHSNHR